MGVRIASPSMDRGSGADQRGRPRRGVCARVPEMLTFSPAIALAQVVPSPLRVGVREHTWEKAWVAIVLSHGDRHVVEFPYGLRPGWTSHPGNG